MAPGKLRAALCATLLAALLAPPGALAAVVVGGSAPATRDVSRPAPKAAAPAAAGAPAAPAGGAADTGSGFSDPFRSLGAQSPFCSRPVGAVARRDCAVSGSIAHAYPLSSYGLDIQIPLGVTHWQNNMLGALQDVADFAWLALVFVMKGVLLLLEWAFSIDLLNQTMSAVRQALETLHEEVIGRPWFVAAIAVAGIWGIWRGVVQRRTTQTLAGLAATVALMVAALAVISNPAATVGHASQLANQASLSIVSATATGSASRPEASFATALEKLFDTTVVGPWAALEFGDAAWALSPAKPASGVTNADVWLAFPAWSSQRTALYKLQKGESPDGGGLFDGLLGELGSTIASGGALGNALGLFRSGLALTTSSDAVLSDAVKAYVHKDPGKVKMQEPGGTFPRLALLALISIGLLGAILLFLYVAVKLMLAAIMSLLLVLLAPAMLLAPAFGESGRATTVAWGKRLVGAVVAKLVYSLLLAILLIGSAAIESLRIGWFATWLVLIAFWWGALLKRRELVGFVSVPRQPDAARGGRGGALRALYGLRAAQLGLAGAGALRDRLMPAWRGEFKPPPATHPELARKIGDAAIEELGERTREALASDWGAARGAAAEREQLRSQLRQANGTLAGYDARAAAAAADGSPPPEPEPDERVLLARREELRSELDTVGLIADGWPGSREGAAVAAGVPPAHRPPLEQRRADLADRRLPPDHPRHLLAAGIKPSAYATAEPQRREELLREARRAAEQDRQLLAQVPQAEGEEEDEQAPPIDHRDYLRRGSGD